MGFIEEMRGFNWVMMCCVNTFGVRRHCSVIEIVQLYSIEGNVMYVELAQEKSKTGGICCTLD